MKLSTAISIALVLLVVNSPAQVLTVNGSATSAQVPVASVLTLELSAAPGAIHYWAIDASAGPTIVSGVSIPVAIGPSTIFLAYGVPMPASGVATWSVNLPNDPALVGLGFSSAAALLAPTAPGGLVVSNGVSFVFTSTVEAGSDATTFVDEPITLDGSGNRDPFTGQVPPGTTFQWSVTQSPPGSNPTLQNSQGEFPVFQTSMPGTYVLESLVSGPGVYGTDACVVHVYDLFFFAPSDGDFASGSVSLTGWVLGPQPFNLDVNGAAVITNPGFFSAGSYTPTGAMDTALARVTGPSGAPITTSRTVTVGNAATLGQPSSAAAGVRLRSGGLDGLEPLIETELQSLDFNSIVQALGTVNVVNGAPAFSANVTPTGGSISPQIDFEMTPDNGHIDIAVTFYNVHVDLDVTGVIFFVNYTDSASIDASSATLSGQATFTPGPGGAVEIDITNANATLNNFSFTLSSFLNGLVQLGLIQNAIQDVVEDALESTAAQIEDFANPLLAELAFSLDLTQYGIPVQLDFPMDVAMYDTDGATLCNTFAATVLSVGPQSPPLTKYLETPPTTLTYPSATPVGGQPYGFSLCLNDDFLNQALTAFIASGALDLDLTGQIGDPPNNINLVAGFMDLLVPNMGFGGFDPMAPVTMRLRHTSAPIVEFTPGSTTHGTLHVGGLQLDVDVEPTPGFFVPVLSAIGWGSANVNLAVDPVTTTVFLEIDGPSVNMSFSTRKEFPGSVPGPALAGLGFVMQLLLPQLVEPVAMITIPSPPFGTATILEVTGQPSWADYLCAYFNVQ